MEKCPAAGARPQQQREENSRFAADKGIPCSVRSVDPCAEGIPTCWEQRMGEGDILGTNWADSGGRFLVVTPLMGVWKTLG